VDALGAAHVRYSMGDVARLRGDDALATRLYLASLQQLRDNGDLRCVASILFNLGALALRRSDPAEAATLLAQSLTVRRQLRDQAGIAECFEAQAAVAEVRGDATAAVGLLGAADALRARTGATRPDSDEQAHATRVAALRTAIGAASFDAAWAAGRDA
jgi:hypothetical protein